MNSASFFALVVFALFVLNSSTIPVEGLCSRPSQTWSWRCVNSSSCNNQCKNWEGAREGSCDINGVCKCVYNKCNAPKLCEKRSRTWKGGCRTKTKECDKQCKNRENAWHGACHSSGLFSTKCYCYFKSC
ncbi:hypothetical protein MKW94_017402 [Papaver nudicaule]|uniref:Knottins-like domain-containing protein n=1 Tax=Papaver nudicaule TaxID=74823 RepID=A0AA42B4U2_PAPNU|nr:hypothetical protein [Papaver nudicaule]